MYQHLATYLYKYKEVNIPEVGTIRLVPQPATLDMGDKMMFPPAYTLEHSSGGILPESQLTYLSLYSPGSKDAVLEQLQTSSNQLVAYLETGAFAWSGIGKIEKNNNAIKLSPALPVASGLQPVPALKVWRQNVAHTVRRGETEGLSSDYKQESKLKKEKTSAAIIAGWIILALAIGFIGFHLYQNSFSPSSSGTRMKVEPKPIAPSHK